MDPRVKRRYLNFKIPNAQLPPVKPGFRNSSMSMSMDKDN
jgi:hypothetical protein